MVLVKKKIRGFNINNINILHTLGFSMIETVLLWFNYNIHCLLIKETKYTKYFLEKNPFIKLQC